MPSQLFPSAREKFLTAQLNWLTGTYRGVLLPQTFVPDFDDQFLVDIFAGVRIAVSDVISNRTAARGVASSDPINFGILAEARLGSSIILFRDTLDETTSDLVCYIAPENIQGTPVPLVGFEYFFIPSALDGGIFRL